VVGKAVGQVRVFGKTLEGAAACFVSCCAVGALIPGISLRTVVAGAAVATLVEMLPIPVDDNFRIPLISGAVMQFLETMS
jgi:dolichol kinase